MRQISSRNWLALILVLSFGLSIFYSYYHHILPVVDARAYDQIAQNIAAGNGFREESSGDMLFDRSIQRAGPAYEYLLAGIYIVFGNHYEAVWIMQALFHALTAWLIYLTALRLFSKHGTTIGLVGAGVFGLHPDLIEIAAMIMTETWYLLLTALALYLFVRAYQSDRSFMVSAALALTLGIGVLSRPPLLLFVPIVSWLFLVRKRYGELLISLALVAAVLTPWTVRNYRVYHQFIPTTVIGEYNLWVGNTLISDGGQLSGGYNPFDDYVSKHGYATVKTAAREAFTDFVREHPGRFLYLSGLRFIKFFSLIRPMGFWFYQAGSQQFMFVAASLVGIIALFLGGSIGFLLMMRRRVPMAGYIFCMAITALLVLLPTVAQSRYRFQIYPFFALATGYAYASLFRDGSKWWKNKTLIQVVLFFALISLLDLFSSWSDVLSHINAL